MRTFAIFALMVLGVAPAAFAQSADGNDPYCKVTRDLEQEKKEAERNPLLKDAEIYEVDCSFLPEVDFAKKIAKAREALYAHLRKVGSQATEFVGGGGDDGSHSTFVMMKPEAEEESER